MRSNDSPSMSDYNVKENAAYDLINSSKVRENCFVAFIRLNCRWAEFVFHSFRIDDLVLSLEYWDSYNRIPPSPKLEIQYSLKNLP